MRYVRRVSVRTQNVSVTHGTRRKHWRHWYVPFLFLIPFLHFVFPIYNCFFLFFFFLLSSLTILYSNYALSLSVTHPSHHTPLPFSNCYFCLQFPLPALPLTSYILFSHSLFISLHLPFSPFSLYFHLHLQSILLSFALCSVLTGVLVRMLKDRSADVINLKVRTYVRTYSQRQRRFIS